MVVVVLGTCCWNFAEEFEEVAVCAGQTVGGIETASLC